VGSTNTAYADHSTAHTAMMATIEGQKYKDKDDCIQKEMSGTKLATRFIKQIAKVGGQSNPVPPKCGTHYFYIPYLDKRSLYRRYTQTSQYVDYPIAFDTFRRDAWPPEVRTMRGSEMRKCTVCSILKRQKVNYSCGKAKAKLADYTDIIRDIETIQDAHADWHMKHRQYYHKVRMLPAHLAWVLSVDGYDRFKSKVPKDYLAAHDAGLNDDNKALGLAVIGVHCHNLKPNHLFYVYPGEAMGHDANMQCAVLIDAVCKLIEAGNDLPEV
jgi:hypothetical protein